MTAPHPHELRLQEMAARLSPLALARLVDMASGLIQGQDSARSAANSVATSAASPAGGTALAPDAPQPGLGPKATRLFFVPEGVRYLDSLQLNDLGQAMDQWAAAARSAPMRRARQRVRLLYLMLRYSGAKLGEVLALDDTRDLDFARSVVSLAGPPGSPESREVILPVFLLAEIQAFLADPGNEPLRGKLFALDQGFVRRKLLDQAPRVAFPRELLNPTVLRHSRAVELLREGVPLPVVQGLLGHASLVLTAGYCAFSEHDSKRILNHVIQKETPMKTSARNTFSGVVSAVRGKQLLVEVVVKTKSGREVVTVITDESRKNLGIAEGKAVAAIVKAPFVLLSKDEGQARMSARNHYLGTITAIRSDDVAVEVVGTLDDGMVMCALITNESVGSMDLKVGDQVWFFFKAFSPILLAD